MTYPNDRLYSADHEWMTIDEPIRVGITAFAAAPSGAQRAARSPRWWC